MLKNCQNSKPNINTTVGFFMKLKLHHQSPSTTAQTVTDPLLTKLINLDPKISNGEVLFLGGGVHSVFSIFLGGQYHFPYFQGGYRTVFRGDQSFFFICRGVKKKVKNNILKQVIKSKNEVWNRVLWNQVVSLYEETGSEWKNLVFEFLPTPLFT